MAFLKDMMRKLALEIPDFFIIDSNVLRMLHTFFASFLLWLLLVLPSISMICFLGRLVEERGWEVEKREKEERGL